MIFHLALDTGESEDLFQSGIFKTDLPLITNSKIDETYSLFKRKAQNTINATIENIESHRSLGYKIVLAGVAAKAMTFFRASNFSCDYFIDQAELKVGRYIPGEVNAILDFDLSRIAESI